ncbi:amphi-Trp domain-containing protein [Pseudenhygromyxa sp. WMMC2535]|uniref:amphi-Trp domain-containing protein n=1 Tax=Pseudenhygromyxa sp. WMMC2535 TaxID=2712867 RepID=UPI0015533603|nr:amphi-Trp domain-containing protein [Pseudenhygromyxa sp. WMMC2535]NVB37509.1 amphi-Trp domain-containing protein [Pseudenhygromyxa sp. WMMC2535]
MGDKKREVGFEGTSSRERAITYLEALTASVRDGAVRVERDSKVVELEPGEFVTLEVKAKSKKDRQSLRLQLSWDNDRSKS